MGEWAKEGADRGEGADGTWDARMAKFPSLTLSHILL